MKERDMTFVHHTPDGDIAMRILFTFTSPETTASYMLYTTRQTGQRVCHFRRGLSL